MVAHASKKKRTHLFAQQLAQTTLHHHDPQLAVPLLVFGAGSLASGGEAGLALTAAASLALLAIAPFAAGAAVRAGRD